MSQLTLFGVSEIGEDLTNWLLVLLAAPEQPSAVELVQRIERELGLDARFAILEVVGQLIASSSLNALQRQYLQYLLTDDGLPAVLRGGEQFGKAIRSSIDELLESTRRYQDSSRFQEMLQFMARFRNYAPYNNMLVRIQNPSCSFFASESDWLHRFNRTLKEDARPMLILAVRGPVMCVYDLDQTKGEAIPDALNNFSKFEGEWKPGWLKTLIENAGNFKIQVADKELSSTNAGFATSRANAPWKMRIGLSNQLDQASKFGVLCHELAHILLGHLGGDLEGWWPPRVNLTHAAVEVEAESVAYLVTERFGLHGKSDLYIAMLTEAAQMPVGVSLDNVARVAGLIERMAQETVKPKVRKKGQPRNPNV